MKRQVQLHVIYACIYELYRKRIPFITHLLKEEIKTNKEKHFLNPSKKGRKNANISNLNKKNGILLIASRQLQ